MKAYLRPPGKSGLARVAIVYKNIFVSTPVKIPPKCWSQTKQKVLASFKDHKIANERLTTRKAEIVNAIEYFRVNGIELTKKSFRQYLDSKGTFIAKPKDMYSVADLLRRYAQEHEKTKRKSYLRKYITIARNLDEHHPNLLAAHFGMHQWNKLVDSLIERGLEDNTIHDYARKIRRVMDVYSREVIVNPDYRDLKYKYIDPKPFWLDWHKVEELAKFVKTLSVKKVYLEEFLFRCYTGLRWSDAHQLKPENIIRTKNAVYIDFTVIKTKVDQNLALSSEAVAILKGWGWRVPRLYAHDCNEEIKQICRACTNDKGEKVFDGAIQKVRFSGQKRKITLVPEWKMVTTHTARRTFARHWMDKGGSLELLRIYLGQSSTVMTNKYVGWHTYEVNDELRRLMG